MHPVQVLPDRPLGATRRQEAEDQLPVLVTSSEAPRVEAKLASWHLADPDAGPTRLATAIVAQDVQRRQEVLEGAVRRHLLTSPSERPSGRAQVARVLAGLLVGTVTALEVATGVQLTTEEVVDQQRALATASGTAWPVRPLPVSLGLGAGTLTATEGAYRVHATAAPRLTARTAITRLAPTCSTGDGPTALTVGQAARATPGTFRTLATTGIPLAAAPTRPTVPKPTTTSGLTLVRLAEAGADAQYVGAPATATGALAGAEVRHSLNLLPFVLPT